LPLKGDLPLSYFLRTEQKLNIQGYDSFVGNLRNGSNDGLCNVNCRNDLSNANWNYGCCDNAKTLKQQRWAASAAFYKWIRAVMRAL
jgi:hypothetical protein